MLPSESVYTVSFFGHRVVSNGSTVESRVEQLIEILLTHHSHIDFLVGRSDFVVFCVSRPHGGAYQTLCYAKKQGKALVNLAAHERIVKSE